MNVMKILKTTIAFAFISLFHNAIYAQKNNISLYANEVKYINLLTDSLQKLPIDSLRLKLNAEISEKLNLLLVQSNVYSFKFDSLKRIGKVYSPDNKFRIISWNVPLLDGTHQFFSFIQINPEKDSVCKVYRLKDGSRNTLRIYETRLNSNNWYGALYYDIIPVKTDKGIVYTLLGLRFNDLFTTQKVIESLYFDNLGSPMFGAPIFNYNNRTQFRVIFEYGINVTMSLRFDERLKMIIFDHLSPSSPLYTNNFKQYGSDFTFDGLKFDDGKWQYFPNVNFLNTNKTVIKKKIDRRPK